METWKPWMPYILGTDPAGEGALKAVAAGTATAEQQAAALNFIREGLCCYDENQFVPNDENATAFALGMKFVAHKISKVLAVDYGAVERRAEYAKMQRESK